MHDPNRQILHQCQAINLIVVCIDTDPEVFQVLITLHPCRMSLRELIGFVLLVPEKRQRKIVSREAQDLIWGVRLETKKEF